MIVDSKFKPAWWLKNSHLQTIYSSITRGKNRVKIDYTERLDLPDGDFIDLAWALNGLKPDTPLVIFLHGLGGNINSSYVASQLAAFNQKGWRVVFMHFRGASNTPNRKARAYHSGDTADLDYLLRELARREPKTRKALVGISVGGNVVLKWLGEQSSQMLVNGAVVVSVPFELSEVSNKFNQGFARVYQTYLLKKVRAVFTRKLASQPDLLQDYANKILAAKSFWEFDDKVTAPLNGFMDVHDYYAQASSRKYIRKITTRTLIIHAKDDPFMTDAATPKQNELGSGVTLEMSNSGGHVGFVSGKIPGFAKYWLDLRIPEYLKSILT